MILAENSYYKSILVATKELQEIGEIPKAIEKDVNDQLMLADEKLWEVIDWIKED